MSARHAILLIGASLLLSVSARATMSLGADHPPNPVGNDGWVHGYADLINRPNRVHGYWVNWMDVFFLAGDAAACGAFVQKCASLDGTAVTIVLHPGRLPVRSPWDEQNRALRADWSATTSVIAFDVQGLPRMEKAFGITIDVYLGDRVQLAALRLPRGITVRSGGEIERFVETYRRPPPVELFPDPPAPPAATGVPPGRWFARSRDRWMPVH